MPTLLPSVFTTAHPVVPYAWRCSKCEVLFDVGPNRGLALTQEQVDEVNLRFEAHCEQVHPRSFPIIGLTAKS